MKDFSSLASDYYSGKLKSKAAADRDDLDRRKDPASAFRDLARSYYSDTDADGASVRRTRGDR